MWTFWLCLLLFATHIFLKCYELLLRPDHLEHFTTLLRNLLEVNGNTKLNLLLQTYFLKYVWIYTLYQAYWSINENYFAFFLCEETYQINNYMEQLKILVRATQRMKEGNRFGKSKVKGKKETMTVVIMQTHRSLKWNRREREKKENVSLLAW